MTNSYLSVSLAHLHVNGGAPPDTEIARLFYFIALKKSTMAKIIADQALGSYEIHFDNNFTLVKNTGKFVEDKKTGKELPVYNTEGYFSTLEGALTMAAKLKTHDSITDKVTLTQYADKLRQIWDEIKHVLNLNFPNA